MSFHFSEKHYIILYFNYQIIYHAQTCIRLLILYLMEGICWHFHVQFETNFNFSDGNYEYHKTNKHGTLIDPSDTSHQVTTHDHFYGWQLLF